MRTMMLAGWLLVGGCAPGWQVGVVEEVVDADTYVVNGLVLRLSGIDAPEAGTAAGDSATAWAEQYLGAEVSYMGVKVGYYGRLISEVRLERGESLAMELVAACHAVANLSWPDANYAAYRLQEEESCGER